GIRDFHVTGVQTCALPISFPGHWRMMQGFLLVSAPGSYISEDQDALVIAAMGGGGSHDFEKYFGVADGKILSGNGSNTVLYTEEIGRASCRESVEIGVVTA